MENWKNKEEYFKFLKIKHLNSKKKLREIKESGDNSYSQLDYYCLEVDADDKSLAVIQETLSDELFEYISSYTLNISLVDILMIIRTKRDIDFFKQNKYSTDGYELKREIEQSKKRADKMKNLSTNQIEITLPKAPHVSISLLVSYLRARGLDEDTIKVINSYFGRQRLPKGNYDAVKELEKEFLKYALEELDNIEYDKYYLSSIMKSGVLKKVECYRP
jgi:hypothetical protein